VSLLLGAAPVVVYSFRAWGDFAPTFASDSIQSMFGYRTDEYLLNADFWRSCVHPDDLAGVEAQQAQLSETGQHSAEYRFRKKDGSYCWVSDEQQLTRDTEGRPVEVVGSWSNMDIRKAAEQAIQAGQAAQVRAKAGKVFFLQLLNVELGELGSCLTIAAIQSVASAKAILQCAPTLPRFLGARAVRTTRRVASALLTVIALSRPWLKFEGTHCCECPLGS
jgi:PAS domain S-box-containing protein